MTYFHLLKNKRGSLPAILIATGIMGFSSVALVTYMQGLSSVLRPAITKSEVSFNIHLPVINSMQALLTNTKIDSQGRTQAQSQYGICSLLKVPSKQQGVGQIEITLSNNLTGYAHQSFSNNRWQHFFPATEWALAGSDQACRNIDSNFRSTPFSKCFRYIGGNSRPATVIARIVPKNLIRNFENIQLSGSSSIDVKKVVFELQALIAMGQGGGTPANAGNQAPSGLATKLSKPSKYYYMIWANAVSECDLRIQGKWVNVQLSGTGVGRLSDHVLINSSSFASEGVKFEDIPARVIMSGKRFNLEKIGDYKQYISADHIKNARIACRKKIYRCPGVLSSPDDYISPIKFGLSITNNTGGLLPFDALNMTFLNEEGEPADGDADRRWNGLDITVNHLSNTNFQANTNLPEERLLVTGQNYFSFEMKEKSTALTSLCNNVCHTGNKYYPSFQINFPHPPQEGMDYFRDYNQESDKDKYRLRCNVCHSKNCYKISLGSFGPAQDEGLLTADPDDDVQGLTDEPLDGQIPECRLKKANTNYQFPSVPSGTGDCVIMKIKDIDSFKNFKNGEYEFHNCTEALPVLCFTYGHYGPAIKVSVDSEPSLFKGAFDQAQKACYEMGREIVEQKKLAGYLKKHWPDLESRKDEHITDELKGHGLPTSGDNFNFNYINNAGRGLFIVPNNNISRLPKRLEQNYLKKSLPKPHQPPRKIYVSMEKDAGGQLVGSIPLAEVASSQFQIFTRKHAHDHRPLILKDTSPSISDTGTGTVLKHNIRYKGIHSVDDTTVSLKALCRKEAGQFVLTDPVGLAQAPQACANKGAFFVPPLSSLEWVKAMVLVNPNDEKYPFPDPGRRPQDENLHLNPNHQKYPFPDPRGFSEAPRGPNEEHYMPSRALTAPAVWVALSKKPSLNPKRAKNWRLSLVHWPDTSLFKTESIPVSGADYQGVIDPHGAPVVLDPADLISASQSNRFKTVCLEKDSGNQIKGLLKVAPLADGCGSEKEPVTEDNLKQLMKSIRFMSTWVKSGITGDFVINKALLEQAKEQAQKQICLDQCDTNKTTCLDSCQSQERTCKNACPMDDPATQNINEHTACKDTCSTTKNTCGTGCDTQATTCQESCP